jgi:hypothetical protein
MTPEEIKARYNAVKAEAQNSVYTIWDLIDQFVTPYRGDMFSDLRTEGEIEWRKRQIFDGTAIHSAQILASSLQGSMTPPGMQWFHYRFRDEELNRDVDAMTWVEECALRCFNALQDSNFNLEANETYLDLVSYGMSIIVEEVEEEEEGHWEGVNFQAIPIRECFFEQDSKGNVSRLYRRLQYTPLQMIDKFGADKVPADVIEKSKNPAASLVKEDVVFCIYRRFKENESTEEKIKLPLLRDFAYKYIRVKDATMLGDEGGYYEMPAYVPRWRKTAGSKFGHSPAMIAMSDILTLNQLVEIIFGAAEKAIDPANVTTERGLLSDLDLGSGGLTVVRNIEDLKPYESRANFSVAELNKNNLQDAISRAFYVDQLQLKESPAMTATEVQARMELMQRLIGPTVARLQNDFLDPMVKRTFKILWRAGRLPEPPESVLQKQGELDIEYVGPMYRASRMGDVQAVQQWVAFLADLEAVNPGTLDNVNFEAVANLSARLMGVPSEAQASFAEILAKQQKRQAAEAKMQSLQTIQTLGGAQKDVALAQKAQAQATGAV